jgi:hypothetical protein
MTAPDPRVRTFQFVALTAAVPVLVLEWIHVAFNAFAGAGWYYPVVCAGLLVNVAAQFAALRQARQQRA